MYFTLGQAAKEVGKSKGTLSNMIKNGKLSVAEKTDKGYKIEASELFRVFNIKPLQNPENEQSTTSKKPNYNPLKELEIQRLNDKILLLEKMIDSLETDKEDYKTRLDKSQDIIKQQTILISDMREKSEIKPVEPNKRFLGIFPYKKN